MGRLNEIQLTPHQNLLTDVEHRRVYNLNNCELNVFETYRKSEQVALTFHDLVITSMVRGKKVMHMPGNNDFDYFPGETVIAPANTKMVIDFPEAKTKNPTQCIALTLDRARVNNALAFLNEYYPRSGTNESWNINFAQMHFKNNSELATVINKMVSVCMEQGRNKDVLADLTLKELLVRLVQLQYLERLDNEHHTYNDSPFSYMALYIRKNLCNKLDVDSLSKIACMSRSQFFRSFKQEFGMTPIQFIIKERLKHAKNLLANSQMTIQQISLDAGFDDVNNFIKLFKRSEGITPGAYRLKLIVKTR